MDKNNARCENCADMRRGLCNGRGHICSDFSPAYTISEEEQKLWPKPRYMGVNYHSQGTRLRGEYCYPKDRESYSYGYNDYGVRIYGI